jgi:hypothetical protein
MTSFYEEAPFLQQSAFPSRSAGESAQRAAISADNAASTAATARLQAEAQAAINAGRHDTIGSAPS